MIIETERLIIRDLTLEDVDDLFEYCSNPVMDPFITFPIHQTNYQTKSFVEYVINKNDAGKDFTVGITLKESNKVIGTIDIGNINELHHFGELAYAINPNYWNKGYATEAAEAILDYGFQQKGLNRIFARCVLHNIGSEKVMQKIRMKYEGVQRHGLLIKGKYQDLRVYAILKGDWLQKG